MKSDHPNSMICPETALFKTMDGLSKSQTEELRSLTALTFLDWFWPIMVLDASLLIYLKYVDRALLPW